uniref:Glycine zipper domain-containing protein n=1 Tax=Corethron hystrix TaxID=216773 RepID=A0A7S1B503_9STRA
MYHFLRQSLKMDTPNARVLMFLFLLTTTPVLGFVHHPCSVSSFCLKQTALHLLDDDENPLKKTADAMANPAAGTAAGAVLGGLVLGPFGALWGASIGNAMGRNSAVEKDKKDQMKKMGITEEMERMAENTARDLEDSKLGLEACRSSAESQRSLAKRLDEEQERLQGQARLALKNGNEPQARKILLERETVRDRLKAALGRLVVENQRMKEMETNLNRFEERALEVDSLIRRNVAANVAKKAGRDDDGDFDCGLGLPREDPLLEKFRDLER